MGRERDRLLVQAVGGQTFSTQLPQYSTDFLMEGSSNHYRAAGWPLIGNALDLARSNGNLVPFFKMWSEQYGDIAQFDIFGEKQVIISTENIAHDLFVKRGNIYSGRGTPHAANYITHDLNPALMGKNGEK